MCFRLCKLLTKHLTSNSYRSIHKYIFQMNKAYCRFEESSNHFKLTFQYNNVSLRVNKQFSFCRQSTESVSTFLNRVRTNIEKAINKKKKRKTDNDNIDKTVNVNLLVNDKQIDGDTICGEIFKDYNNIALKILESEYAIVLNSPWVEKLTLPNSLLANYPTYPAKMELICADQTLSNYNWYKSNTKTADWLKIGEGFIYTPSNDEIGSYLKLECVPKNATMEGPIAEAISDCTVQASPGICPFEVRHQFTQQKPRGKEFRIVTYNILADLYCDSDFSRNVLYPYCPPYALSIDYRKQLILKELIGFNADIICLQEVDRKVYKYDLQPVFSSLKYDSTFQLKGGEVAEGLAVIFNINRFSFLETNNIILGEQLSKNARFADIWDNISKNKKLSERILQRTTTVQTVALESKENDEIILIANTHLYFHPDADHIRLLQGALAIRYILDVLDNCVKRNANKRVSLVYCGDFNSVPECGIYQLYTTGSVSENCVDWQSNKEEAVENISVSQPLKLASACGTPQFTNYTAGFAACLDYIFYDTTKLEISQVIPLPSNEELMQHTALPSVVFPSDHVSLVADLKWLQTPMS